MGERKEKWDGGREGGEKRRKKPRFTMDKGDARETARWLLSS